jgi:hypothetical protein
MLNVVDVTIIKPSVPEPATIFVVRYRETRHVQMILLEREELQNWLLSRATKQAALGEIKLYKIKASSESSNLLE